MCAGVRMQFTVSWIAQVCEQDSEILSVSRKNFQMVLAAFEAMKLVRLLQTPPPSRTAEEIASIDKMCLSQVSYFRDTPLPVRSSIARQLKIQWVTSPHFLFEKGDPADTLFIAHTAHLEVAAEIASQAQADEPRSKLQHTPSQMAALISRSPSISKHSSRAPSRSPDLLTRTTSPILRLGSVAIRSRTSSGSKPDLSKFAAVKTVGPGEVVEVDMYQHVREKSCRISQDGYVLHVEAAHCQSCLKAWQDDEAKQKLELIESALDCHAGLQPDLLAKIAACFVSKIVPWGAVLGKQKEPVEDIFIAKTAACGMRMDLLFERPMQDDHNLYAKPAAKCRKSFDISSAGPKDCLGLGQFLATGCWDATVRVVECGTVLQASRKRLFSILEYYPRFMDRLRQQEAKKLETKQARLMMLLANFQQQVCAGWCNVSMPCSLAVA